MRLGSTATVVADVGLLDGFNVNEFLVDGLDDGAKLLSFEELS
jgi:hypothetical protein